MRGKHFAFVRTPIGVGITPADAGKTLRRQERNTPRWDHPRGCGENFFGAFEFGQVPGSPPRMRGKHFEFLDARIDI